MHCKIKVGLLLFSRWYIWVWTYEFNSVEDARKRMARLMDYRSGQMDRVKLIPGWVHTDEHPRTLILRSWFAPLRDDRKIGFGLQPDGRKALIKKVFRFIVPGYKPEKEKA